MTEESHARWHHHRLADVRDAYQHGQLLAAGGYRPFFLASAADLRGLTRWPAAIAAAQHAGYHNLPHEARLRARGRAPDA